MAKVKSKGRGVVTTGTSILMQTKNRAKFIECYTNGNSYETCCALLGISVSMWRGSKFYNSMQQKCEKGRAETLHLFTSGIVKQAKNGELNYRDMADYLARIERDTFGKTAKEPKKDDDKEGVGARIGRVLDKKKLPKPAAAPAAPPEAPASTAPSAPKNPLSAASNLPHIEHLKAMLAGSKNSNP